MNTLSPKEVMIALVMGLVWGLACMYFAKKKGRDPKGWFILGLLFSIFAFAALMLIPSEKSMQLAAEAKALQTKKEEELQLKQSFKPLTTTLENRKWFYLDTQNTQNGPIDLKALKVAKAQGSINSKTYLWSEGMLDWKILEELSYLKTELE